MTQHVGKLPPTPMIESYPPAQSLAIERTCYENEKRGEKSSVPVLFNTTFAGRSTVATRLHLVGLRAAFGKLKTRRHGGR